MRLHSELLYVLSLECPAHILPHVTLWLVNWKYVFVHFTDTSVWLPGAVHHTAVGDPQECTQC